MSPCSNTALATRIQLVADCNGLDVTEGLATLLDFSMVSPGRWPDGEQAFRLLEVIRRFAYRRLQNPDDILSHLETHLLGALEAAGRQHGAQDWARRRLDSEQW